MDARRKALEAYSKQVAAGNDDPSQFINMGRNLKGQALQSRDLAEDALANEFMKRTDLPVPGKGATRSQKEDFLNRATKQVYPEFEPDVKLNRYIDDMGSYSPTDGGILVKDNADLKKMLSTTFHEGAHKYDNKVLNFDGTDDFSKVISPKDLPTGATNLKQLNPSQLNEIIHKGHHAKIPNLRDSDSFGLGALKSMMKSGTFKQVAGALPLVGGVAAAAMSGDASAAVPLLDEAEDVGMSASEEIQMLNDHDARVNYDNSPAHKARLQALQGFGNKK